MVRTSLLPLVNLIRGKSEKKSGKQPKESELEKFFADVVAERKFRKATSGTLDMIDRVDLVVPTTSEIFVPGPPVAILKELGKKKSRPSPRPSESSASAKDWLNQKRKSPPADSRHEDPENSNGGKIDIADLITRPKI